MSASLHRPTQLSGRSLAWGGDCYGSGAVELALVLLSPQQRKDTEDISLLLKVLGFLTGR